MKRLGKVIAAAVIALGTGAFAPVWAKDLAVIVNVQSYDELPNLRRGAPGDRIRDAAQDAGFETITLNNPSARELRGRMASVYRRLLEAENLVVVLIGHFVTDGTSNWLLARDAERQTDPFDVGAQGMSVDPLMKIMGSNPGRGMLVIAPARPREPVGAGLTAGFAPAAIPQGVAVVIGEGRAVGNFLREDVFPGAQTTARAVRNRDLSGHGFIPRYPMFQPSKAVAAPAIDPAKALQESLRLEQDAFDRARQVNSISSYQEYLRRYPNGRFAGPARELLAVLQATPEERARAAEADLNLSRNQRREVQRNLSILEYDPRGIDGIFGPGTRAAIKSWQRARNFDATGYLSGNQVSQLKQAAAVRQNELEAEARRRQAERDREDGEYWRATGRGESEDGLRLYLDRYPDGLFAQVAEDKLAQIEAQRRASARAADRSAWQAATTAGTAAAFRAYLRDRPNGAFVKEAQARLKALQKPQYDQAALDKAKALEGKVLGNPLTRSLVERRLDQLGLNPGPVDGRFEKATRRAIRVYQRDRGLNVTGFIDQPTLVRMLAGG